MKKIFTLVLLMALTGSLYAQRIADLQVTLTSPAEGEVFYQGDTISIGIIFKNLGPDAWEVDDSIAWQSSLSTSALLFKVNRVVPVGDTLSFFSPFSVVTVDTNLVIDFCLAAIYFNREGTSRTITDTDSSNNRDCNSIEFRKRPVSIDKVNTTVKNVAVYPNPAVNEIGFRLEGVDPGIVNVYITDMAGREVMARSFKWNAQNRIDVTELSSGIYQIHIRAENGKRFIGKFIKQ